MSLDSASAAAASVETDIGLATAPAPETPASQPSAPQAPALAASADADDIDILIVDDEPEVLAVLKRQMQRKGYNVRIAANAGEAANALTACSPRVVLLDLMMPQIDGAAFLKNLRANHSPGALPVIIVTASNQREDMMRCLDAGANDFVTKPVDLDALAARVEIQIAIAEQFRSRQKDALLSLDSSACASEALWDWTPHNDRLTVSSTFNMIAGAKSRPGTMAEWLALFRPGDAAMLTKELARLREGATREVEVPLHLAGEQERALLVRARLDRGAEPPRVMGAAIDVTVPYLRDKDSALPAIGAFIDRIAERRAAGRTVSVIGFAPTRFEELALAHRIARADDALHVYIRTVSRATEEIGELFRLGPADFAILAHSATSSGQLRGCAKRLASGEEFGVHVGADQINRIGSVVGFVAGAEEAPEELLFRVRLAMKSAAENGGGACEYTDELKDIRLRHARVDSRLSVALETGAIEPLFRPIVDVAEGCWIGLDAGPAWIDSELGRVPTDELFASLDLMGRSADFVEDFAGEAMRIVLDVERGSGGAMFLSLPIPDRAAASADLPERIAAAANLAGFNLARLVIEVSEDGLLSDFDACAASFRKLNAMGVRIAIGQFGSSYSSLTYLSRAPAQVLKFDDAMLEAAIERDDARSLLASTSRMARHLGKAVVLTGVDDVEHRRVAREVGAVWIEGRVAAGPMNARELGMVLASGEHAP